MIDKEFMEQWVKERDEAILSLDVAKFRQFYEKYKVLGIYQAVLELPSNEIVEVSMRQAILGMSNPPKEAVEEARKWLRDHGLNDDPWRE